MKNLTIDSNVIQQSLTPELEKLKTFLTKSHLVKSLQAFAFLENILEYELNQSVREKKNKKGNK